MVCDGCKSKHLIADRIGWFKHAWREESESGKKGIDVEMLMEQKGEQVVHGEVGGKSSLSDVEKAHEETRTNVTRLLDEFQSSDSCFEYIPEKSKCE